MTRRSARRARSPLVAGARGRRAAGARPRADERVQRRSRSASASPGPWVVVPAHGEADVPARVPEPPRHRRRASTRSRARSDVRVTFDGQHRAARSRPGTDDHALRVLPRRLGAATSAGAFQPRHRLHPARSTSPRSTLVGAGHAARRAARPRRDDARARSPGTVADDRRSAASTGEHLVDELGRGRVRRPPTPPALGLADADPGRRATRGRRRSSVTIATSEALPRPARRPRCSSA